MMFVDATDVGESHGALVVISQLLLSRNAERFENVDGSARNRAVPVVRRARFAVNP